MAPPEMSQDSCALHLRLEALTACSRDLPRLRLWRRWGSPVGASVQPSIHSEGRRLEAAMISPQTLSKAVTYGEDNFCIFPILLLISD